MENSTAMQIILLNSLRNRWQRKLCISSTYWSSWNLSLYSKKGSFVFFFASAYKHDLCPCYRLRAFLKDRQVFNWLCDSRFEYRKANFTLETKKNARSRFPCDTTPSSSLFLPIQSRLDFFHHILLHGVFCSTRKSPPLNGEIVLPLFIATILISYTLTGG